MAIQVVVQGVGTRDFESGVSILDVLKVMPVENPNDVLAAKVNDTLCDLSQVLTSDVNLVFIDPSSSEALHILRHSAAHVMAQAIRQLYPDVKYAAGPSITDGFYYDLKMLKVLSAEDFGEIETRVQAIVGQAYPFVRSEKPIDDAIELFGARNDAFKVEFLRQFKAEGITHVSLYQQGDFLDLCRGPHICHTGQLRVFKLVKVSGAYWKGDSNNEQLQRVYGTAFFTQDDLEKYVHALDEAKRRDHRKLGKDLEIVQFDQSSPGFPIWQEHGTVLFNSILNFIRNENSKRGYEEVKTPILFDDVLWQKSGHLEHFEKNMYFTQIDKKSFALKPMNCPGHCLIYKSRLRSYRELPLRLSEFGLVHRNELSGVLHGLFRLRSFTQDDAHVFCTKEDLRAEITHMIEYVVSVYRIMGFEYTVALATRPESSIGSTLMWEESTRTLQDSLDEHSIPYTVKEGEGAFYGPKIEFNIQDCLARSWQCGTIQVDFSMPQALELSYESSDGTKRIPVMIHRAILGSLERFIGILLEHCAGRLPFWLAPVQIQLLAVHQKHEAYLSHIEKELTKNNLRVKKDLTNEKLGYKIRKAQLQQIPYMLVIGDREQSQGILSVRKREDGRPFEASLKELIQRLREELFY